jgi:diguanylate cyclase (GGDEF)-like protein
MHDAVRRMCEQLLHGEAAEAVDLQAYQQAQSAMVARLNMLRERIGDATMRHDVLTGLPLRHGMAYAFELLRKDARRSSAQLWLAMIDVDHFKRVNDSHGHAVGDLALQHIARLLASCMRGTDALFRYGGEEFLALLVVRAPRDIQVPASRLIDAVSAAPLTIASGATLHLTATVGLACVRVDEDLLRATERADQALLQGKRQGRNRFVVAPD